MKCFAIKIFAWNVLQLPIQKFNCKFMHIYYRLRGYVKFKKTELRNSKILINKKISS